MMNRGWSEGQNYCLVLIWLMFSSFPNCLFMSNGTRSITKYASFISKIYQVAPGFNVDSHFITMFYSGFIESD